MQARANTLGNVTPCYSAGVLAGEIGSAENIAGKAQITQPLAFALVAYSTSPAADSIGCNLEAAALGALEHARQPGVLQIRNFFERD